MKINERDRGAWDEREVVTNVTGSFRGSWDDGEVQEDLEEQVSWGDHIKTFGMTDEVASLSDDTIRNGMRKFRLFQNREFRPNQLAAIRFVLESQKRFCVVEAPTGSGKTLIAMTSGEVAGGMTYMVHSKNLQDQVTGDFGEAVSLFGRGNYECLLNRGLTCDMCTHSKSFKCGLKKTACVYELAKKKTIKAKLKILNYDYFLTEANYVGRMSGAKLVVIDEADNLENSLINFVSLVFTDKGLGRHGLEGPARKTAKSKLGIYPWIDFATEAKRRALEYMKKLEAEMEDFGDYLGQYEMGVMREALYAKRMVEKLDIFLDNVDDTWLFDDREEGKYVFRPLWITEKIAEYFLWRHGKRFVLMSATFPPRHILAKMLGMPEEDIDYMVVPSNFPSDRRPVRVRAVANVTAKTMDKSIPALVKSIEELAEQYKGEKGLVHCVSYKLGERLLAGVNSRVRNRMIVHDGKNKSIMLDRFMESDEPLIMVSPSMDRGVNLPDESCRWIVIAKAPFMYMGDKIVSARVYSGRIGRDWYASQMLMSVVQMTGRGFRHEGDRCDSWILDEQFSRVMMQNPMFVPEWWKDALWF